MIQSTYSQSREEHDDGDIPCRPTLRKTDLSCRLIRTRKQSAAQVDRTRKRWSLVAKHEAEIDQSNLAQNEARK